MRDLVLIDYGAGNLHSVEKALHHAAGMAGAQVRIERSAAPDAVRAADQLVLPGVGAFAACRAGLDRHEGLTGAIIEAAGQRGVPLLGICVGMQLLASLGEEHGHTQGLDLIPGRVRRLDAPGLKVPHMGWNTVEGRHAILPPTADAYFVHSYAFVADDPAHVVARASYGQSIAAMVARDNLVGVQFHPEKSGAFGLDLLARFLTWDPV